MLISNTQDARYYLLHESLRKSAEASGITSILRIVAFDPVKNELQIVSNSGGNNVRLMDRAEPRRSAEVPNHCYAPRSEAHSDLGV